ncbi:MAG TPA: hypothetical protein DEQ30_05400 [Porphyromonadaceae bacterium]|nr:hypothetical protein [Porphyromonadaceae bacterium]
MKFLLFCTIIIAFFSCSNEEFVANDTNLDDATKPEHKNVYRILEEDAIKNLLSFIKQMEKSPEGAISTRNKAVRTVKNIEIIGKDKEKISTYASGYDNNLLSTINADTLMYLINFEEDQGFAIVSADKRSNNIYAIVDEGFMDVNRMEQINNPGFILFMESAVKKEIENLATYDIATYSSGSGGSGNTGGGNDFPTGPLYVGSVAPKLKTKWGQGYPYNLYCPNGWTGCVSTAMAQIYSYYQTVSNFKYNSNNITLNWSQIISDCENTDPSYGQLNHNTENTSSVQIAHFMRYLGYVLNANYYTDGRGTAASSREALDWMLLYGKLKRQFYEGYYTANHTYTSVAQGHLVYIIGRKTVNGESVGHAWIIDGGIQYKKSATTIDCEYFVHCNWGWNGVCDGYYKEDIFNHKNGPVYWEKIDSFGIKENSNYDHGFATAVIYK